MTEAFTITKAQYEYLLPVSNIKSKMLRRFTSNAISYSFIGSRAEYIDFLNRCKFL
jgi:acetate kinase